MYCLQVITSATYQTPKIGAPALTARDSSFCKSRAGLVLHSAIHRSTCFLPVTAPNYKATLASLRRRKQAGRNKLIESFF